MSGGWINLSAAEAEKLLQRWGFELHTRKGGTNLWKHDLDEGKQLIPFADPSSGRQNGRGSFRTAAAIVGMPVSAFLKGPTPQWYAKHSRTLGDALATRATAPDPLGIQDKVVDQRRSDLIQAAMSTLSPQKTDLERDPGRSDQRCPYPQIGKPAHCNTDGCRYWHEMDGTPPPAGIVVHVHDHRQLHEALEEKLAEQIPAPDEVDPETGAVTASARGVSAGLLEKALDAIEDEALTAPEVALLLECSPRHARDVLGRLVEEGSAVRRKAAPAEVPGAGTPPWLYLAGVGPIPTRKPTITVELEPIPEEPPVAVDPTNRFDPRNQPYIGAALQREAEASVALDRDQTHVVEQHISAAAPRVFEEAGVWPLGGILVKDEDGQLYVARKLVEEGR